mgnify:CR=1 FL=1
MQFLGVKKENQKKEPGFCMLLGNVLEGTLWPWSKARERYYMRKKKKLKETGNRFE